MDLALGTIGISTLSMLHTAAVTVCKKMVAGVFVVRRIAWSWVLGYVETDTMRQAGLRWEQVSGWRSSGHGSPREHER
jgi:hypothetical protein